VALYYGAAIPTNLAKVASARFLSDNVIENGAAEGTRTPDPNITKAIDGFGEKLAILSFSGIIRVAVSAFPTLDPLAAEFRF
tara:strand:+ start:208 stop:453 length:246 start_codon:yes stop_codon:yes gene_type:complete